MLETISSGRLALLVVCLLFACAFEFVNGFHDTANAVATVIYTKSLKPWIAVLLSSFFNFIGVFLGGIAVAVSILKLLPTEILMSGGAGAGIAMVLALLTAAIAWNLGTWYLGIPASSSHTLIGSVLGVGLAHSTLPGHHLGSGVNWTKAYEVALSLLVSPLVGFGLAAFFLLLARKLSPDGKIHQAPEGETPPPRLIRGLLIGTCTGVSFAHGSNDGQKGVGIIMLILIGILPAEYAVQERFTKIDEAITQTAVIEQAIKEAPEETKKAVLLDIAVIRQELAGKLALAQIPKEKRWDVRKSVLDIDSKVGELEKKKLIAPERAKATQLARGQLRGMIDYAPPWVLLAVALSLGIGTTVGWKRIVITVGEKIGKSHLTYAQGASAEVVAMGAIGMASFFGLPVSTTHVLSSGIAGTMVANGSGVQGGTLKKIGLAWLLTLPVCMVGSGAFYLLFRKLLAG